MLKMIAAASFGLAFLLAPACSTSAPAAPANAVKIIESEAIFAAADWTPDVEAAARAAGWADRFDQIKTHMNQSAGWPKNLADDDRRFFEGPAQMNLYKVEELARLKFYDQDAVLLLVRASANQHMVESWRPKEDFFMIMSASAVAKTN